MVYKGCGRESINISERILSCIGKRKQSSLALMLVKLRVGGKKLVFVSVYDLEREKKGISNRF